MRTTPPSPPKRYPKPSPNPQTPPPLASTTSPTQCGSLYTASSLPFSLPSWTPCWPTDFTLPPSKKHLVLSLTSQANPHTTHPPPLGLSSSSEHSLRSLRVVASRLSAQAAICSLIYPLQCGSLPGRSTTDAALVLQHNVESFHRLRYKVSTLFLNVKGGFDNMESPSLLSLLRRKGVSP